MYSAQVLECLNNPRHAGELDHPDALARRENPACGDVLQLALRLAGGSIATARFLVQGCVPAIACGEALCILVEGKTPAEARAIARADLLHALGGLPAPSRHAAALALETLAAALDQLAPRDRNS